MKCNWIWREREFFKVYTKQSNLFYNVELVTSLNYREGTYFYTYGSIVNTFLANPKNLIIKYKYETN